MSSAIAPNSSLNAVYNRYYQEYLTLYPALKEHFEKLADLV